MALAAADLHAWIPQGGFCPFLAGCLAGLAGQSPEEHLRCGSSRKDCLLLSLARGANSELPPSPEDVVQWEFLDL